MKKILTASCLCKGIKFKTSGEHRNVSNCHCIQCRKTHGIYGSYSNVKDKDITENFEDQWRDFVVKSRERYRKHKQNLLDEMYEEN